MTSSKRFYLGAHVSAAGGVSNAITNTLAINATSSSFFLKPRTWKYKQLSELDAALFRQSAADSNVDITKIIPHGQYIVNLASSSDGQKWNVAYDYFADDIKRCERLGIKLYNMHPGSTKGECSREEGYENVSRAINRVHKETEYCRVVLENMAGQGNVIGGPFEDLAAIIELVEDKSRVGVCMDTCHMFAYGYDLRTQEAFDGTWNEFDRIIGFKYLAAMHLNDSKTEFGSKKDRHENICKGFIGLDAFRFLMNDDRFQDIPLVLETPINDSSSSTKSSSSSKKENFDIYRKEIELLKSFCIK